MKIGLISDTHGDAGRTARAAKLLKSHGVEAVIHCGDIGSQRVLIELVEVFEPPKIPVYAVNGNVDYDDYVGAGVELLGDFGDIKLGGKRIAIAHGHDGARLYQLIASQRYDFVFTGHTHIRDDRREGRTRIINPGAVYRAAIPGVAVIDTETGALMRIDL